MRGLTFGIGSKYEVLTLVGLQLFTQEAQITEGCLQGRATFASFSLILNLLLKCCSEELAAIAVSGVAMQGSEEGHCNATCMSYQSLKSLPRGDLVPPNLCGAVLLCLACAPYPATLAEPECGMQNQQGLGQRGIFCSRFEHGNIPVEQPASITPAHSLCSCTPAPLYHFSSLKTRLQDWRAGARAKDRGWLDGPISFCLGPA